MMHPRWFPVPLWSILGLLFFGGTGDASVLNQTLVHRPGQVRIHADALLDSLPERGHVPLHLTLRNELDRKGTWTLVFTAERRGNTRISSTTTHTLSVEARGTRQVALSIPVAPSPGNDHSRGSLRVDVSGPAVPPGTRTRLLQTAHRRPGREAKHLGMSRRVARALKEPLREVDDARHGGLTLHTLDANLFPADGIGLSGLDILLLHAEDWNDPRLRAPIARWVATGGQLFLDQGGGTRRSLGMGNIHPVELPSSLSGTESFHQRLLRLPTRSGRLGGRHNYRRTDWDFADRVPAIAPSLGGFMLVVVGIAIVLGPLNLWWGYKRRRMVQVLWTTPILSIALGFLVGAGILLGDGFGGKGQRSLWIHLVPAEKLELRLQEQVSRTGVLFQKTFSLPPETLMVPVQASDHDAVANQRLSIQPGGTHAGDWFANRHIQAQVLEQVRTSRADVRLLTPPDISPPRILSTLNAPLSRLVYRDIHGDFWTARDLSPGDEITLRSIPQNEALRETASWFNRENHPGKNWLRDFPRQAFAARSENPGGIWTETLSAIDWQDRPAVFTGRTTPAPEGSP